LKRLSKLEVEAEAAALGFPATAALGFPKTHLDGGVVSADAPLGQAVFDPNGSTSAPQPKISTSTASTIASSSPPWSSSSPPPLIPAAGSAAAPGGDHLFGGDFGDIAGGGGGGVGDGSSGLEKMQVEAPKLFIKGVRGHDMDEVSWIVGMRGWPTRRF
jgi:hypothetical protein